MSDMLQLVVEIHNTQAMILAVTNHLEGSQSRRQAEEPLAKLAVARPVGHYAREAANIEIANQLLVRFYSLRKTALQSARFLGALLQPMHAGG